jgi:5-(carboxyamino)imidazole ribonucleotide mutase
LVFTSELKGIDALLSISQMPGGMPVACVGIGASRAKDAALLAAQISGIEHKEIKEVYERYREKLGEETKI